MATSAASCCGKAADYNINDLPDEVLETILKELSPPAHTFDGLERRRPATDLQQHYNYLKVCRRWRRIYEQFFYRSQMWAECGIRIKYPAYSQH